MAGMNGRTSYLLDGRRVTVTDLIENGLLRSGEELEFVRVRTNETHRATIAGDGSLSVGGRVYRSPSAAAAAAAGTGQYDGWTAWTTDAGTSLHTLRRRLLDTLAAQPSLAAPTATAQPGPDTGAEGDEGDGGPHNADSAARRHRFLVEAREAAESGRPRSMSVRSLLRPWGARTRGARVSERIEADLANHGLATDPDFLSVTLDDETALVVQPAVVEPTSPPELALEPEPAASSGQTGQTAAFSEATRHREIAMTLGNLTKTGRVLVSIKSTSSLEEATTKMLINDFSQLPVLKNDYILEGAVTWKSIARAQLKDPQAPLSATIVPAEKRTYDHDLNDVLPILETEEFVVVTDNHTKISGIVTVTDVVGLYEQRTLPYLLVTELDLELRRVMARLDPDLVRRICAQSNVSEVSSYDDMTMAHYECVLANPEGWKALGWPLNRKVFIQRLRELREARNEIAHSNRDAVPADIVAQLKAMLHLIRQFCPDDGPA